MPRVGQELASFSLCLLGPLFSGSVPQGEPVCQPFRGLERLAGHRDARERRRLWALAGVGGSGGGGLGSYQLPKLQIHFPRLLS